VGAVGVLNGVEAANRDIKSSDRQPGCTNRIPRWPTPTFAGVDPCGTDRDSRHGVLRRTGQDLRLIGAYIACRTENVIEDPVTPWPPPNSNAGHTGGSSGARRGFEVPDGTRARVDVFSMRDGHGAVQLPGIYDPFRRPHP
jgi:hypothetical protein